VLGINSLPVTIKQNEKNIVERGFEEGWIRPSRQRFVPERKSPSWAPGRLDSPRRSSSAAPVMRSVLRKADRIGGLLRYGIPQFKLEKNIIDRRLEQMSAEGVKFVTGAEVGRMFRSKICGATSTPFCLPGELNIRAI
jgi:glutamate synthase (NADPH) small chain